MAENYNNRIEHVDLFRGIGIILMVFGHMKFIDVRGFDVFYHLIHAFHMPMFFFLAGYCYKKSDANLKITMLKKARNLLIPYFVFGISEFALWRLFEGDSWAPLFHLFWINTEGLAIAGALWFLTALFIASVSYFVMDRYISNKTLLSIICFIISIAGCILPGKLSFRLPYAMDAAMVGVGFIHIGRIIRQDSDKKFFVLIQNLRTWQTLLLIILAIVLIMYNGAINMRTGRYASIPLFWINAVIAIIVGLNLCKGAENTGFLGKKIRRIGQIGIVYVCINELVITVFARILNRFIDIRIIYNILLVILVFVTLWIGAEIMIKTPLRILLGHGREQNNER